MSNSSRTKNTMMNTATSLFGQGLVVILKFVTRTVFIHVLGSSYLGINGLFTNILSMLALTELGFDTAINFKLYKPLAEGDTKRVRLLMKFYKMVYNVVGLVIFLLGLCMIPLLPFLISDYDSLETLGINAAFVFLLYLLQTVSSYAFVAYRSAIVKADQKEYILNVASYAVTIATNIAQILVLYIFENFVLYTAVLVIFNIVQNYAFAIIAKRMYPDVFVKDNDSLDKQEIIETFKDCGAVFLYKANGVVLKATDNIVLSSFIGLTIVGRYSNYTLFYSTIQIILQKVTESVKASMGNLFTVSKTEEKIKFFEVMNYLVSILYGTAAVGIAVVADELVECWIGNEYVIAQPLSILIGIEIFFVGIKTNLSQVRTTTGVFWQMWFRPLLGIIINIGLSIALVKPLGIYGVIIATIVADVSTIFMVDPRLIYKYSFEGIRPAWDYYKKNLIYIALLILIALVDTWMCSHFLVGFGWVSVIVHILICAASVPLVFLGVFWRSHECKYLINKTNGIVKKIAPRNGR